jgi:hypothetical protein
MKSAVDKHNKTLLIHQLPGVKRAKCCEAANGWACTCVGGMSTEVSLPIIRWCLAMIFCHPRKFAWRFVLFSSHCYVACQPGGSSGPNSCCDVLILWVMTPCCLVAGHEAFGAYFILKLEVYRRYARTKLHGVSAAWCSSKTVELCASSAGFGCR